MAWLKTFLTSTLGLKVIMAVSGVALFGFVLAHMAGNLQIYLGERTYNHYAAALQGNTALLWTARTGLLGVVLAHIVSAGVLTARSRAARPTAYDTHRWLSGTYAVRTMRFGGVVILAFIVYHLLHFTVGTVHPNIQHCRVTADDEFVCFAYQNFVAGFQNPAVVGFYVLAQVALGLHLAHGVWSMLRTLGLANPRYDLLTRRAATAFGTVVTLGNISMPIAVLAGLVK